MIEEFDAQGDMKSLFKKILGSNVTIKDNLRATEVNVFCLFIQKLEESKKKEDRVFEESGIELKEITDPLWMVIESTMKMIYGVEAVGIIFWYLYERYNPDGTVIDLVDEKTGKSFSLKTPKDLFSYIKHRFPTS
jgi:hypothetical protein